MNIASVFAENITTMQNSYPPIRDHTFDNVRFISGTSHPELSKSIASLLHVDLADCTIDKFSNGEIRVQINENIRGCDVVIFQTGSNGAGDDSSINDVIIETLLIVDALKRSSAAQIILFMPHFPYARQDKKDKPRCPISGRVMANLIENTGVDRLITMDLHASQIAGFFNIPVDNLYTVKLMADYLNTNLLTDTNHDDFVIVSPDAGGIKRMYSLAEKTQMNTVIMHKERSYEKKNLVQRTVLIGSSDGVRGKSCIIIDDMCDTAGDYLQSQ